MRTLAAWAVFRRIHLRALIADWRRTLLSIVGVAVGVTVVLGTLILRSALTRPFEAFGPALTHASDVGVLEVTPNISGRLPLETVTRLRSEVKGAQAVIPVVAGLTPIEFAGASHGFFLLGGSCQIELLVGPFQCDQRARDKEPAAGPGIPLLIPSVIAERHGLRLGAELHIPGLPAGSAHIGWTFAEFDRVKDINEGYVLFAPTMDMAAQLLGSPGYATAAFVLPRGGAAIAQDVDRVVAGIATAGPPRPIQPAVFDNASQSFNLNVLAGVLIGVLISVNTILLAVEDRRAVMGTIGAIGAKPVGLFVGMLGEGAVVGALGGVAGLPSGFALGTYLVERFGRSMLAGSGGTITTHVTFDLIAVGAVAGTVSGMLAMLGPAWRLVRAGPLASMASAGGVQRSRSIRAWALVVGIAALVGAMVVSRVFERGALPLNTGINAMAVGLCGVVLSTVWTAPRGAALLIGMLTVARPAIGRPLGAEVRRYTALFALSAALLTAGTSAAIGTHSMQRLGTAQIAAQKAELLPSALLIRPQSVLDQRDGWISDATFSEISAVSAGRPISSRWRSTISSGTLSRLVTGVSPGDWHSRALYQPTTADDAFWQSLGDGDIGLSQIAASRLGARRGDIVELPTVAGPKRFRVAGIFLPRMINDAAVGDIVLTDERVARVNWAAVRDQTAVNFSSVTEASAHRDDFLRLNAGLRVYDNEQWSSQAASGINRFLEPFTVAGYLVVAAAGLSMLNVFVLGLVQRKRERAALRAIGMTAGQEQAVILNHAGVLATLVAGLAVLGGVGMTYLWSLGSPVYYGIAIRWGVPASTLRTAVQAVFVVVFTAALYPLIHARRLETVEVLREN